MLLFVVVHFVPFTPRGLAMAVAASLCLDFARAAFAECSLSCLLCSLRKLSMSSCSI
jgi:hypothetical protein